MATHIADSAAIHPQAEIDDDVEIGPFCVVGPHVRIGRGTRLENNVTLMGLVTLGESLDDPCYDFELPIQAARPVVPGGTPGGEDS